MDVFGGAPRFLAYPRPVVVQSGTDAVLKCQIGGDPRPAVIWERNNEKIHAEGRYRVFEDGNVYNLIITSVTMEDSGQYICKAKNCIGETYAAATLKVEGEAQEMEFREENKPRFLIKPLSTRVGRGEDAVFSCKLWGNPRPEVMWEKDGKKLNEIFESTHFAISYQDGGWFQLKIFKTRAPDGGVYTCKARNEFGESLAGAVLLVDAGPGHEDEGNPKVKMFAVTEGKHAKFLYIYIQYIEIWHKLNMACTIKDPVAICSHHNPKHNIQLSFLGSFHLVTTEPPVRFKQPLNDLQVWERDLAVLECEVPEDSVPITWYLEDRRLQPGAKYGMEEWGTKRRLTIRDIAVDDDGIYLCEMADGGRSIAEVAVKGTIVRKLPRKVDVLEGENAAFCVEVEEEEMDIHWYKDGTELRETHQTILKSFGRTHILVFVNTTPQDSGRVMFYVGRSKTSSQLRVKAARHCPPSCPIGVQINTERANAALLSWFPAQDSRKNPPSGYIIERQEVGSQEWLQCLTTDSATSVEILGDSVPCEADYRFRICSVNKYGRSGNVEFPREVHLVPVARIQAPLQDALVPEGQDACFTIELSASVIGTWFLNGNQLQDDDRFSIRRSRTHQSLRIRGVRDTDNGSEITFIAYGIRDSAALYIQAPLVKFTPLSEMDRNKFVEVVLQCELSDPLTQVSWYKDGVKLLPQSGLDFRSKGTKRQLIVQSAEFYHSGVYSCKTRGDAVHFNVDVKAPPVRFSAVPEVKRRKCIEAGCPIVLQCEVSDSTAQVQWYKDGDQLLVESGVDFKSDDCMRTLSIQSAHPSHAGVYSCTTKDDVIKFHVEIRVFESRVYQCGSVYSTEVDSPNVLKCDLSDATTEVLWCKDGRELVPNPGLNFQTDGNMRKLTVQSAELSDTGNNTCHAPGDTVSFKVDVQAHPVRFSALPEIARNKFIEAGCPIILQCEISDPTAQVSWLKDGVELLQDSGLDIQSEGTMKRMIIKSAELKNSGVYSCEAVDDRIAFKVDVAGDFENIVEQDNLLLCCQVSRSDATAQWYKDGVELKPSDNILIEAENTIRRLIVLSAQLSDSGTYTCRAGDNLQGCVTIFFCFTEPPVMIVYPKEDVHLDRYVPEEIVLSCELSRPNGKVTWFKDGQKLQESENIKLKSEGPYRRLKILHSAEYVCDTADDSVTFFVNIAGVFVVSDAIVLKCEISRPNGVVSWLKDNEKIEGNEQFICEEEGTFRSLIVLSAELKDSGEYICDAQDDKVVFSVTVEAKKTQFQTYQLNHSIAPNRHFTIRAEGRVRSLTIHDVTEEDAGEYACESKDERTSATVVSMDPVVAEEFGEATLEVEVSLETAEVQWMRQGVVIHPGSKFTLKQNGQKRSLTIHKLTLSDRGTYSCETLHDRTRAKLTVERESALLLSFSLCVTYERETASFEVELSHGNVDGVWQKDGHILKNNNRLRMTAKGRVHSLTISNLTLDDTGTYIFYVENIRSLTRLERELEILQSLEDLDIQEGQNAVFMCEVSLDDVPREWFKNGEKIKPTSTIKIRQEGTKHFLLICNVKEDDSGEIKFVAKNVETTAYLEVEALPANIVKPLQDKTALEKTRVILDCTVTNPRCSIRWYKGPNVILPSERFEICSEGCYRKLVIQQVLLEDEGTYSVQVGNYTSSAKLTVEGEANSALLHQLWID
uniref:Obscurin like cytoskeletal adaptor 1b n=1 Tax=Sinocyclocheilus anshuiensis TaxID=1608454 RepID=A0A671T4K2_9TELE